MGIPPSPYAGSCDDDITRFFSVSPFSVNGWRSGSSESATIRNNTVVREILPMDCTRSVRSVDQLGRVPRTVAGEAAGHVPEAAVNRFSSAAAVIITGEAVLSRTQTGQATVA